MRPFPQEVGRRFNGHLYRDHNGASLVADVEGSGVYKVHSAHAAVIVDEGQPFACGDFTDGSFSTSLVVLGEEADVSVLLGSAEWPSGGETLSLPVVGSGYLLQGEDVVIDQSIVSRSCPSGTALPFFNSLEGTGAVRVALTGGSRLVEVDRWQIDTAALQAERQFSSQNLSATSVLRSAFSSGEVFEGTVASHLNAVSWTVHLPAGAQGLRLRKTYDRFHGRQRARVLIDGRFAGWWYEPEEDREQRWGEAEFGVAAGLVEGKSVVRMTIDPPAGAPLWSVSEMKVFAVIQPSR